MERHLKGEFHVLFKDMKWFHYEYFFKHIAQHLTVIFFFFIIITFFIFFIFLFLNWDLLHARLNSHNKAWGYKKKKHKKIKAYRKSD